MRQLSGLDTTFLALDGPTSVGHLTLLVVLAQDLDPPSLRARVASRLDVLPVLRRQLVNTPGGLGRPYWTTVAPQLDGHLFEQGLPDHWTRTDLVRAALESASVPLPRDRPLWRINLLRTPSSGCAVVTITVHHAVADGLAIRDLVLSLLDEDQPGPEPSHEAPVPGPRTPSGTIRRWAGLLDLPLAAGAASLPLAGAAAGLPAALASRVLAPSGPRRSPLPGHVGGHRTFGLAQVPLAEAQVLRSSHDASVNDVILAAAAGGLRRHLVRGGEEPGGPLYAVVPIARRDPAVSAVPGGGNSLALARCAIPVHEESRENRLQLVRKSMRGAMAHPFAEGPLVDTLSRFAVPAVATPALRLASRLGVGRLRAHPFDLMVSNVPVPGGERSLAGAPVVAMYPVPLVAETLPLNITAHGYGDTLCYGVTGAPAVIGDAAELAELVRDEHARLAELAGAR